MPTDKAEYRTGTLGTALSSDEVQRAATAAGR